MPKIMDILCLIHHLNQGNFPSLKNYPFELVSNGKFIKIKFVGHLVYESSDLNNDMSINDLYNGITSSNEILDDVIPLVRFND